MFKMESYVKNGKNYELTYESNDKVHVLEMFSSAMIARMHKARYIKRIEEKNSYQGYRIFTVFDDVGKTIYYIEY